MTFTHLRRWRTSGSYSTSSLYTLYVHRYKFSIHSFILALERSITYDRSSLVHGGALSDVSHNLRFDKELQRICAEELGLGEFGSGACNNISEPIHSYDTQRPSSPYFKFFFALLLAFSFRTYKGLNEGVAR